MATTTTVLFLIFLILKSIIIPTFSCPIHQKQALLYFKSNLANVFNSSSTQYENLDSWDPASDCRSWARVTCSRTGSVTELELNMVTTPLEYSDPISISSEILTPIFRIQSLESLDISENLFKGEIPRDGFGNLTKLRQLYMSRNYFIGSIPSSIANLTKLEFLDLADNSLSLEIPTFIGRLTNLNILYLNNNQFTGLIPSSMQNLSKLSDLWLKDNMLAGEIPTWLFNIRSLKEIYIGGKGSNLIWNNITKVDRRCSLQDILMPSCGISGQIPEWISSQKELNHLDLSGNKLEGRFPHWLAEMPNIQYIVLSDNNLSGQIPPCLFISDYIRALDLSRNKFSGELPENIGNVGKLWSIMGLNDN